MTESETQQRGAVDRLRIPWSMRDAFLIHLISSAPNEGCGLISIREVAGEDGERIGEAVRWYPGTNISASPHHFSMDPREVLAASQDMERSGTVLGAIVHSHLRGPATPSPTDISEAYYPDAAMVIVSLAIQPFPIGGWRIVREDGLAIVQSVELDFVEGA